MTEKRDMRSRVEETLDKVRPAMRADGGDARIVACDDFHKRLPVPKASDLHR